MTRTARLIGAAWAVLWVAGCATTGRYNTPYINTDETMQLREGMRYDEVSERAGRPLMVISGDAVTGEIAWIYEVRGEGVRSGPRGEPVKHSDDHVSTSPLHRLEVVFKDGVVHHWGPYSVEPSQLHRNKDDQTSQRRRAPAMVDNIKERKVGLARPRAVHLIPNYQEQTGAGGYTAWGARLEAELMGRAGLGIQAAYLRYADQAYGGYRDVWLIQEGASEFQYGGYAHFALGIAPMLQLVPSAGVVAQGESPSLYFEGRLRALMPPHLGIEAGIGHILDTDAVYYTAGVVLTF